MAKGNFKKRRDERNRKAQQRYSRRYGTDELNNLLIGIAFVLIVINIFVRASWLGLMATAVLVYTLWRGLSTQVDDRRNENEVFLDHAGRFRPWLRDPRAAFNEARTYKHVMCPDCGQKVRVPRHKGKLRVTCPKCHTKFEVKS